MNLCIKSVWILGLMFTLFIEDTPPHFTFSVPTVPWHSTQFIALSGVPRMVHKNHVTDFSHFGGSESSDGGDLGLGKMGRYHTDYVDTIFGRD